MFRRRFFIARRPRLFGAALIGGLGFAAGRASKGSPQQAGGTPLATVPGSTPAELTARLQQLADLHVSGSLTDEEFAAAKAKLLAS